MQEPIVVVVEFLIRPDQVDRWLRLATEHLRHCVAERGMLRFWIHRDDNDPTHFLFYEEWADREDLETSLRASWRDDYLADTRQLWKRPRSMTVYTRVPTPWEPPDEAGRLATDRPDRADRRKRRPAGRGRPACNWPQTRQRR